MSYSGDQKDYLQPHSYSGNSLPQGLNVLSILTYIGSGFQVLGSVFNYFISGYSVRQLEKMKDMERQPGMRGVNSFFRWSADATMKQYEHRFVLLLISVAGAALCIYGVLQMRKLKKQGLIIYSFAELLFPVVTAILVGFFSAAIGLFAAVLFIILYTTQRKHLIN